MPLEGGNPADDRYQQLSDWRRSVAYSPCFRRMFLRAAPRFTVYSEIKQALLLWDLHLGMEVPG
jgi:hypothetical protein